MTQYNHGSIGEKIPVLCPQLIIEWFLYYASIRFFPQIHLNMVHKKSEYRLNYKWIPSNLCKQSWETGLNYRVQRRLYDLSHLPLPWEAPNCECDEKCDESDVHLPIPKVRMKHNVLKELWDREAKLKESSGAIPSEDWYRHWEEREHQLPPQASSPKVKDSSVDLRQRLLENTETGKGLDPMHFAPQHESQALQRSPDGALKDYKESILKKKDDDHSQLAAYDQQTRMEDRLIKDDTTIHNSHCIAQRNKGTQTFEKWSSLSPRRQKMDISATHPTMPLLTMPKILPYGWASQRDVGDKRTFNIYAPTKNVSQFYPSALRAWKRKEIDIERAIEDEKRAQQKFQTHYSPINHSSIWKTEYQHEYNDQKYIRPASAPPTRWRDMGHIYHQCSC